MGINQYWVEQEPESISNSAAKSLLPGGIFSSGTSHFHKMLTIKVYNSHDNNNNDVG